MVKNASGRYRIKMRSQAVGRRKIFGAIRKRYVKKRGGFKYRNIIKDVMHLKRIVNVEYKHLETTYQTSGQYWDLIPKASAATPGAPGTTGYIYSQVPYPAEGDDSTNREGRQIKLMSLYVNGVACPASSSATVCGTFKIMVVLDKEAQDGETVDPVPIMFDTDQRGLYSTDSKRNKDKMGRFTILAVRNVKISNGSDNGVSRWKLYRKLSDHIRFSGTTSISFQNKAFYVVALADTNCGASYVPAFQLEFSSRLQWVDN